MRFNRKSEWLEEWQNKYQSCYELWQELEAKALSHQLTEEQHDDVVNKMMRAKALRREIDELTDSHERWRRLKQELWPLENAIETFCKDTGYPNLVFVKKGKKGLRSIDGREVLPPVFDDICFTFDGFYNLLGYYYGHEFVVKRNGKWGVVDNDQEIVIPFEYDFIFRKPFIDGKYILIKDGKQGMAYRGSRFISIPIGVEMDAVYQVPEMDLTLFTKDGKWGWWWPEDSKYSDFYESYSGPLYDEIFIQRVDYRSMDDEYDEYFYARKGDELYYILYWTIK